MVIYKPSSSADGNTNQSSRPQTGRLWPNIHIYAKEKLTELLEDCGRQTLKGPHKILLPAIDMSLCTASPWVQPEYSNSLLINIKVKGCHYHVELNLQNEHVCIGHLLLPFFSFSSFFLCGKPATLLWADIWRSPPNKELIKEASSPQLKNWGPISFE